MHRSTPPRVARTAAGFALTAVTAAVGLSAYVSNGYTWATHQVPYYVNPANADGLAEAAVIDAVRVGADAWSAQSNADFQFYFAGRTSGTSVGRNAKNEVFFRNEANGSTAAVTYWWYDGSGHLVDADILFYDGGFSFFTGTSGCSGGIYIEDVATHEFGHALGLTHTGVSGATMQPSTGWCSQNWRTLEADDIAGVEALYPPGGTAASPPSAPVNLSARANASAPSSAIDVAWNDPSDEEQVLVERSVGGTEWLLVATLAANTTTYADQGLSAGSTYAYRARAANSAGYSGYSNTAAATTAAPTAPGVPAAPSPSDGAGDVNWSTTLSWNAANAERFDVYFGTSQSPPLHAAGVSAPSLDVGRLAAGKTFYWRVVAKNGVGSATGGTWRFTTRAKGGGKKK